MAHPRHAGKGRPRKEASPAAHQWQIVARVTVNHQRVDEEALRKACFIVGTNELESEALSDQELVTTYAECGIYTIILSIKGTGEMCWTP